MENETLASALWKKLEDLHERKTIDNKFYMFKRLVNFKYKAH